MDTHVGLTCLIILMAARMAISNPLFASGCDRNVSSKGTDYYTVIIFNKPIDMPCPPGTIYQPIICDCRTTATTKISTATPKATTQAFVNIYTTKRPTTKLIQILKNTTSSSLVTPSKTPDTVCRAAGQGFEEYLPGIGWAYSDCFGGRVFNLQLCRCVDPNGNSDISTGDCSRTPYGDGFVENIDGIGEVYSDCPANHKFVVAICKCVLDNVGPDGGSNVIYIDRNTDCKFKPLGDGYVETIAGLGDVYSDCPADYRFNTQVCRCIKKGTLVITKITTPAPSPITNSGCKYKSVGNGFSEHIVGVGDVYSDCPALHTFNIVVCRCVKIGTVVIVTPSPVTKVPSTVTTKGCNLVASGDGYIEHITGIGDVYNSCPTDHTFNAAVCLCIRKGTNPQITQAPPIQVTNSACKLIPSGSGYIERISGVGDVYSDCPSGHTFNVVPCKCIPKGTNPNPPQATQSPPIQITNPACSLKPSGTGYIERISGVGDVYSDCPSDHTFNVIACQCILKGTNPKVTQAPSIQITNPACSLTPSGKGYIERISGVGDVYSECPSDHTFSVVLCKCVVPGCNKIASGSGYIETITGVGSVYGDCPSEHVFKNSLCKCVKQDAATGVNPTKSTNTACRYTASGSGYIEHISGVGDVYSDCPADHLFSGAVCKCVKADSGTIIITQTQKPPTNDACKFTASGDGYVEHIAGVGVIYSDCPTDHTFNVVVCQCVKKGAVIVNPTHAPSTNKDCNLNASGDGYIEHIAGVGDIYSDCPTDHTFNVVVCQCVKKGVAVIINPTHAPPTNQDCKFNASGDGYIEHIAGVRDIYSDCPSDHTFNVVVCQCVKKGTAVIVNPTPAPPTNKNCKFNASGDGYIEHIAGVGDIYSDCPSDHTFNVVVCQCVKKGTQILTVAPTVPSTTTTSHVTNSACQFTPVGDGYTEHISGVGDVYSACPTEQKFSIVVCACVKKNCNRMAGSGSTFIEEIPGVGLVHGDCGAGKVFSTPHCDCTDKNNVKTAKPNIQTTTPSTATTNKIITTVDSTTTQVDNTETSTSASITTIITSALDVDTSTTTPWTQAPTTPLPTTSSQSPAITSSYKPTETSPGTTSIDITSTVMPSTTTETSTTPQTAPSSTVSSTFPVKTSTDFDLTSSILTTTMTPLEPSTTDPITTQTSTPSPSTTAPTTTTTTTQSTTTTKKCRYLPSPDNPAEFRMEWPWIPGQYVYYNCDPGFIFDSKACGCMPDASHTTQAPANPDCPFLPSSAGSNYFRFNMIGIGWVELSCSYAQTFSITDCACTY